MLQHCFALKLQRCFVDYSTSLHFSLLWGWAEQHFRFHKHMYLVTCTLSVVLHIVIVVVWIDAFKLMQLLFFLVSDGINYNIINLPGAREDTHLVEQACQVEEQGVFLAGLAVSEDLCSDACRSGVTVCDSASPARCHLHFPYRGWGAGHFRGSFFPPSFTTVSFCDLSGVHPTHCFYFESFTHCFCSWSRLWSWLHVGYHFLQFHFSRPWLITGPRAALLPSLQKASESPSVLLVLRPEKEEPVN